MPRARIVCCSTNADPGWRWVADAFATDPIEWEFTHPIPRTFLQRRVRKPDVTLMAACWRAVRVARDRGADLLLTHDPRATFWCQVFAKRVGLKVPHVAHSFNFASVPQGAKRVLMSQAFRGIEHFIVYSSLERDLYSRVLGMSRAKIEVRLWGALPPRAEDPGGLPENFVCALGGNRRDYATLMAAMERLPDVPLVAVVRPENLKGIRVPANVIVKTNIPFAHAMGILERSRLMALPLDSETAPCGHVTLVAAMHMGKPFVVTRSKGVVDYCRDRENCLFADLGSAESLAGRVREVWEERGLAERLGESGRAFARAECTPRAVEEHFRTYLQKKGLLRKPVVSPVGVLAAAGVSV